MFDPINGVNDYILAIRNGASDWEIEKFFSECGVFFYNLGIEDSVIISKLENNTVEKS